MPPEFGLNVVDLLMNKWSIPLRKHSDAIAISTVDTIRISDRHYQERFPIPYCRQHSIWPSVVLHAPQFISKTRSLRCRSPVAVELLNMYHDPTYPVAKRITKAIGSSSIFSLSFMKREKRRPRCGQLRCLHPCLTSGLHRHMSVGQSVGGARIHSQSCTFSIGE